MKKNKTIWSLLVIVILIVLLVVSVGGSNDNKIEGLNKLGIISSMSGDFSDFGQEFANGAILASEIYNKNNPEKQIEVILEDDGFDSKKALSAYKKLTGLDDVDALINFSTPSINAIYDLVQSDNKVILQLGEQATEPKDDLVYGLFPGSIHAQRELGQFLRDEGYNNPLVVYTVDDTAIRFKDAVVDGYGSAMKEIGISANETDIRTHVSKIINEDFDILVVVLFPTTGAKLVAEFPKQGVALPKFAFDTIMSGGIQEYKDILGDLNILNGSIVATFSVNKSEDLDNFQSIYVERFGISPGFLADMGYDAFNLLIETYDEDTQEWKDNTQNISYKGVNGMYNFDSVGIRLPDTVITTIQDGEIVN